MTEKKIPNLKNATKIKRVVQGYFGDPWDYEEILFRTRNNRYVLVQRGGTLSPYPSERIQKILKAKAQNGWKPVKQRIFGLFGTRHNRFVIEVNQIAAKKFNS